MKDDIKNEILKDVTGYDKFDSLHDLYEYLNEGGEIDSIIDSSIDIYYYDLRKWAVDNYDWIDEAIDEGLCEGVTDFHKLIQCGQWLALNNEAREIVEELFNEYNGKLFNVEKVA
jgi:hypothetical protein